MKNKASVRTIEIMPVDSYSTSTAYRCT